MPTTDALARRARILRNLASLLYRRAFGDERQRRDAGYALLDEARRVLIPDYRLTQHDKAWWNEEPFVAAYRRLEGDDFQKADRIYLLAELVKLVNHLDGDTAEAGVYRGTASWFICDARGDRRARHWAFDSFAGLSRPQALDGTHWQTGDLTTGSGPARRVLAEFDARIIEGWIPEVFQEAQVDTLVFAHVDVDLYAPTLASFEFFYPKLPPGGVIVCDDYGFTTCPGATQAVDEFMATKPEPVIRCPTGQAFVCKW
jgi:hypothetical protein